MSETEISDDEKEEEYSPSAEVSDESDRNGDTTEQSRKIVSVFVGNLGDGTGPPDIKDLFESYGITVDHVDMKICFAFVHCLWVTNLPEIVNSMQGGLFRNSSKVPKIEISKGDGNIKKREERRNKVQAPSQTLFVIGFDPIRTSDEAIISTFSATAAVQRVLMRKNFCFVRFDSIEDATKVKDQFHGQDVWGRTLSIQFSSGNTIDFAKRSPSDSRPEGSGSRSGGLEERGRRDDSESNRGNKLRPDGSVYPDGRGNRDSDATNLNRNDNGDSADSRNYHIYDNKRSNDDTYNANDNYLNRRNGRDDVYDRDGRSSNGNDRDGDSRSGGKSNFINRSRSRDRHNGNLSANGYSDRSSADHSRNAVGGNNSRSFSNHVSPSVSVITLPFPASGGRFIYEHSDGRREYVEAVFSSSFGASDSMHSRAESDITPASHSYDDVDKGIRSERRRSRSRTERIR